MPGLRDAESWEDLGPGEMHELFGEQRQYIHRIQKGPVNLAEWNDFVAYVVSLEVKRVGRENADWQALYGVWLKALPVMIQVGKVGGQ